MSRQVDKIRVNKESALLIFSSTRQLVNSSTCDNYIIMNRLKATIVLSLLAAAAVAQETDHHETQHTIECEARVASPQVQAARRVMAGGSEERCSYRNSDRR